MVIFSKYGIQLFYCIYFITSIVTIVATTDEYINYIVPIVEENLYL